MDEKVKFSRFQEKTTSHIRKQALTSNAIREMYFYNPEFENIPADKERDILLEKGNSPIKGLVHKFTNRVAVFLSYTCAANCRYCERQDRVGVGLDKEGRLGTKHINDIIHYIAVHPEIREVVLSGGDPLTNSVGLQYFCESIQSVSHVKTIRLHTKLPVQAPHLVDFALLEKIVHSKPVFYFSIHINHPDELDAELILVIAKLRSLGFLLLSQSVFLKGINDNADILTNLFTELSENAVRPYYIYHCQSIPTTQRFVMTLDAERELMTILRERLSGIAYPSHVIDLQGAIGKVIVPTQHWQLLNGLVRDYNDNIIDLGTYDQIMYDTEQ